MKEPTEHLTTMAESLAVLRERLPEWPPIKNDESKIRAALQVLTPEYRAAARSRNSSARVGRWWSTGFEDPRRCGMQELELELKRLLETAWKLQLGPDRNQIFRELEQFRLRINALQERAELPERKNAPA